MAGENLKIEAGEPVVFSTGEYSDYGYGASLVFRKTCDLEALAAEYGRACREGLRNGSIDKWGDQIGPQGFEAWLVCEGHAVPFTLREIHIGGYGQIEIGNVQIEAYASEEDGFKGIDGEPT